MRKFIVSFSACLFALLASAQGHAQHGAMLCELHQMSLADPINFDGVMDVNRDIFDNSMVFFIRDRVSALSAAADQHDAECNGYAHNPQLYTQCKSNNLPRMFVVWLGSVLDAAGGVGWSNTLIGREQIASLHFCQQMGIPICDEMQDMGQERSRAICPYYLG